jgi:small subunit ribosomal protein S1
MNDGKSRQSIKKYLPDDIEVMKALESALLSEEASAGTLASPELRQPKPGDVVEAKIIGIQADAVRVDVGWKADGVVPCSEFPDQFPAPGSTIRVRVLRLENADGQVACSAEEAKRADLMTELASGKTGRTVDGRVIEAVKGGLVVDVGLRAFMPAREAGLRFIEDLQQFVGQRFPVRVIECNAAERRIIVSRRALLEESRSAEKEKLFATLAAGQVLDGTVVKVLDFGAFVDLGGAEGLLHKGDMAWGRVQHPSELVKEGDHVRVAVLNFDRSSGKISLGLKQTTAGPWDTIDVRHPVGSRHRGRVVGLLDFGAVVELEPGLSGMVHVSELSWEKRVRKPADVVQLNQEVDVEVIGVDVAKKKLSLSMRRIEENPHTDLALRFPFATIVEGEVKELLDFGAAIRLDSGAEGLVHVSELAWGKRVNHPSEIVKLGQRLTLIVLGVEEAKQRLKLSLKQTEPDPWWDAPTEFPVGSRHQGRVTRVENFGAFVELKPGFEGLMHVSRMGGDGTGRPGAQFKQGASVQVEVVELAPEERRAGLALVRNDAE